MNPKDLAVLSAMITPAVLIMASSSLILATSQRLSRIMDRARKMNDHVKHINNDESLTQVENDVYEILHFTLERGVILQRTLSYLYISLTTFVATSTSIGFIDITHVGRVWIPILLSILGVSLLLLSSLLLIRESRIALTSVKKETELIRLMNQRYFQNKRKRRMLRGAFMISLKGRKALITGASSGIGKAIALAFGEAGADVMIHYHSNEEEAERVVEEVKKNGVQSFSMKGDLSNPEEGRALFAKMIEVMGGVDILIANAGIQKDAPFLEMTLEEWEKVINVNLTAQFVCVQEAVKIFCKNDPTPSRGKIIFMNSVHQVIPWAGRVNYAASKGGLKLLMESLAQEISHHKIRVNAIAPGAIKTNINKDAWDSPEEEKELIELIPYGRIGDVNDVAKAALWLASDESDYIVGTTLYIDGGMKLYPGFKDGG